MSELNDYLVRSAAAINAMVERDLTSEMERAVSAVVTALSSGKAFLICGNGGSASDAIHIAGELVGRFLKERKAYKVIALPANASVLTAWGNDYGFDTVFSRQVEAHGAAGGVLLAISTSGNSPSILAAAEQARMMDMTVIGLTGDTGGKLDSPLYGLFEMRGALKDKPLAQGGTLSEYFIHQPADPYTGFSLKWDGEWQVTYETFRDMGLAYAVGLMLIYILVVAQFKSYLTPLVIMAPIPLTIIGVMPGHALLGAQFTATSMIGMIALAGIIVRNSILLVDFINEQAAAGMDFQEAVIQAGATRARPIVLTGLAAMLGAFFILTDPIFQGLAVSLVFGVMVSTVLTLLVIPLLYYTWLSRGNGRHLPSAAGQ